MVIRFTEGFIADEHTRRAITRRTKVRLPEIPHQWDFAACRAWKRQAVQALMAQGWAIISGRLEEEKNLPPVAFRAVETARKQLRKESVRHAVRRAQEGYYAFGGRIETAEVQESILKGLKALL